MAFMRTVLIIVTLVAGWGVVRAQPATVPGVPALAQAAP